MSSSATPDTAGFGPEQLLLHQALVRGVARALLRDEASVDDVEQATWTAALEGRPDLRDGLGAWLATVARRQALRLRRSRARREAREQATARREGLVPSPAEITEREDTRARVLRAILELPAPRREALLARYDLDLSERDAAERLAVPIETLRSRLKAARADLRRRLEAEFGERRDSLHAALLPLAGVEGALGSGATLPNLALPTLGSGTTIAALALATCSLLGLWWAAGRTPDSAARRAPPVSAPLAARSGAPSLAEVDRAPPGVALPDPSLGRSALDPPVVARGSDPAPAEAAFVFGRVVDEFARPIPGAQVSGFAELGGRPLVLDAEGSPRPAATVEGSVPPPSTSADGRGFFRLPVSGTGEGGLHVVATAPGLLPRKTPWVHAGAEVELELIPATDVAGVLRDAAGAAVSGGRITFHARLGALHFERTAEVDPEGRFLARGLPLPTSDRLTVVAVAEHGQHPRTVLEVNSAALALPVAGAAESAGLQVFLAPARTLEVEVVDAATGAALVEAEVSLDSDEGAGDGWTAGDGPLRSALAGVTLAAARTDAAGRAEFTLLPARGFHRSLGDSVAGGRLRLGWITVTAPGRAVECAPLLLAPAGARQSVRIPVHPAGSVRGRVVDERGQPLAGVALWRGLRSDGPQELPDDPQAILCRSDGSGRFSIPGWPVGGGEGGNPLHLRSEDGRSRTTVRVDLGSVGVQDLGDLLLPSHLPRPGLRVAVHDGAGHPVAGATISGAPREEATDGQGRAVLLAEPDQTLRVVVVAPGFGRRAAAARPSRTEELGSAPDLGFVLEPGEQIRGRVIDRAGRPVPSVVVSIRYLDEDTRLGAGASGPALAAPQDAPAGASWSVQRLRSAPDGNFEFEDLGPGPYLVAVRAIVPGAGALQLLAEREVQSGEFAELAIDPPDFAAYGTLEVALPAEAEVRSAELSRDGRRQVLHRSDPRTFRSPLLAPGDWELEVHWVGRPPHRRTVTLGAGTHTRVAVDLEAGARLRGRVQPTDPACPRPWLALYRGAIEVARLRLQPDGSFDLDGLEPGPYRFELEPCDGDGSTGLEPRDPLWLPSHGESEPLILTRTTGQRWRIEVPADGAGGILRATWLGRPVCERVLARGSAEVEWWLPAGTVELEWLPEESAPRRGTITASPGPPGRFAFPAPP
jgi:RNA polymerase sigma-70 factor (ECF subfamily)